MLSRSVSARLRQFPVVRYVVIFRQITAYSEYTSPHRQVIGQESPHHPILKRLHWLPIRQCIEYKVSLLSYKIRQTGEPKHLLALLIENVPTRNLRSSERSDLEISRTQLALASRVFSIAAPRTWNSLPTDVTSAESLTIFRKRLNTYLFNTVYKHYTLFCRTYDSITVRHIGPYNCCLLNYLLTLPLVMRCDRLCVCMCTCVTSLPKRISQGR